MKQGRAGPAVASGSIMPAGAFGEFVLDANTRSLRDARGRVELEARAFDVLLWLLKHRDRVVSKRELLDAVWGDQAVGESTLTRIISLLRKALRDSSASPRYLLTVRGRGYRFVAEVTHEPLVPPVRTGEDGLVGREAELARAESELRRACAGALRVLWISGPPGIGKTSLARALRMRAAARGVRVAAARCDGSDGAPPFWPWIQVLRSLLALIPPEDLDGLLMGAGPDLVQLAPELAPRLAPARGPAASPTTLDAEQARFRLFDSVARFLSAVATPAGLLVALDDLHHADEPSLLLLEFLARHQESAPLLLVASFRTLELAAGDVLARTVARVGGTGHELALGPLAVEDVAPLLAGLGHPEAPDTLTRALHERTGGNPLFLRHLAPSLGAPAEARWRAGALDEMRAPATVLEAVREDLARRSEPCLEVLRVASVLGREVSLSELGGVAGLPLEGVLGCVDEAVRARVLEPLEVGGERYRFTHALLAEALYADLPVERRVALHARVAGALASPPRRPGDAARIAHHYWNARPGAPDVEVRRAQADAAREAFAALSYEAAVRHATRALEIPEPWSHDEEPFELLLLLSEASHLQGDYRRMREWGFRAAEHGRLLGRQDLVVRAALAFFGVGGIGQLDAAWVSLAEEAIAGLGEGDSPMRARLLIQLGLEYYWAGHTERGLALSAAGEELARGLDDPSLLDSALDRLSLLRHPDRGDEVLRRVNDLIGRLDATARPETELRARLVRHDTLLERGRHAEARIDAQRVLRRAEELRLLWPLRVRLLYALLDGRHAEVEDFFRDALASGRLDFGTSGESAQNFMVVFFHLRLQQERLGELVPMLSEWAARFPAFPGVRVGLVLAHAAAGQRVEALDLLDELARHDFEDFPRDQVWLWLMGLLAEACRVNGCKEHLPTLLRLLGSYGDRVAVIASDACLGSVARILGGLHAAVGRPDTAIRLLERALEVDAKLGAYVHLRTALELAEAHALRGGVAGRRRARELSERAAHLAETRGLDVWEARARALRVHLTD